MADILVQDFVLRALAAGLGVALVAGPLGCLVVWRRMAYFGDTMAHAALLGVALGLLAGAPMPLGVLAVGAVVALLMAWLMAQERWGSDTLLGIFSHTALALGLVALGLMAEVRVDLLGYLFGDILAVTPGRLAWIYGGGGAVLAALLLLWRPLLAATVGPELARAEGVPVGVLRFVFMLLIAVVVAVAMQIVGVLLITALLIIPAAAARGLARGPEAMAVLASVLGAVAVVAGIMASVLLDTPTGPSIVVAAFLLFLLGLAAPALRAVLLR